MQIVSIVAGPLDTNGYLVIDSETGTCAVVDTPLNSANTYMNLIKEKNLKLKYILLTHSHWDHTGDCSKLAENTNAEVLLNKNDEYRLSEPDKNTIFQLPFKLEPYANSINIDHNESINIGNIEFEVLHTPGHTEGSVCFVEHNHKVIFSGDTLFKGNVGRYDLPGGNEHTLYNSLTNILLTLPDDYKVYSGHGSETTIGFERKFNPFIN